MKFSVSQRWRNSVYFRLPISRRMKIKTGLGISIYFQGFENVPLLMISLQTIGSSLSESS